MALPKAGEMYFGEDGSVSMVLDDAVDPNYEPTKQELKEYAEWLGIDPVKEKDLMWIAREGLKAPLPKQWKPCKTDTGDLYYFNFDTGESIWDHPLDEKYKKIVCDERAKIQAGGVSVPPNGPAAKAKAKDVKDKKLKKGGDVEEPKPKGLETKSGALPAPDFRPKSGRLSSIGSGGGGNEIVRPDVSDLLPAKQVDVTSPAVTAAALKSGSLFGAVKSVSATQQTKSGTEIAAEEERKFKEKLNAEHEENVNAIRRKHQSQMEEMEEQLENEMKRLKKQLQDAADDEIETARRNAERQTKRELEICEDSIERQKEDLRRSIRQLRQRFESEEDASRLRVETEVASRRRAIESTIHEKVQQRKRELEVATNADQSQAVMFNENKLRSIEEQFVREKTEAERNEAARFAARMETVESTMKQEVETLQAALQRQRQEAAAAVHHVESSRQREEYAAAEARYAVALEEIRKKSATSVAALRLEGEAALASARHAFQQKLIEARSKAENVNASEREKISAVLRAEARQRIEDHKLMLENKNKLQESEFVQETQELVQQAKDKAAQATNQSQTKRQADIKELQKKISKLEDREVELLEKETSEKIHSLEVETTTEIEALKTEMTKTSEALLEQKKRSWKLLHPEPSCPPLAPIIETPEPSATTATTGRGAALSIQAEYEAEEANLKAQLASVVAKRIAEHRSKVCAEISKRLDDYRQERSVKARNAADQASEMRAKEVAQAQEVALRASSSVSSPVVGTLTAEAQQRIALERQQLQQRLDQLAISLAASSQRHPAAFQPPAIPMVRTDTPPPHLPPRMETPLMQSAESTPHRQERPAMQDPLELNTPIAVAERRLRRMNDKIRVKKNDIRQRQRDLEALRAEWKADMATAKEKKDVKQMELLHIAKGALEERARALNAETLTLKKSIAWAKKQEMHLHADPDDNHHNQFDMMPAGRYPSTSQERTSAHSSGMVVAPQPSNDAAILQLLSRLAEKVESVEKQVQNQKPQKHQSRSGARGQNSGRETQRDPSKDKWRNVIAGKSSTHTRAQDFDPHSSASVEMWLEETASPTRGPY